jgi:hypothetical protein
LKHLNLEAMKAKAVELNNLHEIMPLIFLLQAYKQAQAEQEKQPRQQDAFMLSFYCLLRKNANKSHNWDANPFVDSLKAFWNAYAGMNVENMALLKFQHIHNEVESWIDKQSCNTFFPALVKAELILPVLEAGGITSETKLFA